MRGAFIYVVFLVGVGCVAAQVNGNSQSRSGSPTGMRGGLTERSRSPVMSEVFQKTARLVHLTPDELSQQYSSDASTCAVTPKNYVALLMAQDQLKLDRRQALQEMCKEKTNSFAKAMSVGSTLKVQLSSVAGAQDLQAHERAYLKEIDETMKKPK